MLLLEVEERKRGLKDDARDQETCAPEHDPPRVLTVLKITSVMSNEVASVFCEMGKLIPHVCTHQRLTEIYQKLAALVRADRGVRVIWGPQLT